MWFLDIAALIGYVRTAPWGFQDLDWTAPTAPSTTARGIPVQTHRCHLPPVPGVGDRLRPGYESIELGSV
jgi:hypothetical protein